MALVLLSSSWMVWRTPVLARGLLIAFEGVDQSGKRTQAKLLVERLKRNGFKVNYLSFPIYTTAIGEEIKTSLEGRRSYIPQVQHMLLAANRWEVKDEIERWLEQGHFVVANRYFYSNYAYGVSKGLDLDWLRALDRGLPEPNLVILLNISSQTSASRKLRGRDVHERNLEFLTRVKESYLQLARSYNWIVVNGEMPIRTVHEELWKAVKPFLPLSSNSHYA
jgi:dTMP kinase